MVCHLDEPIAGFAHLPRSESHQQQGRIFKEVLEGAQILGADGVDGGVGRIDDGGELRDAHQAEIGVVESAAGVVIRGELLVLGPFAEGLGYAAALEDALELAVADVRRDETVLNVDGKGDMRRAVVTDGGTFP